MTTVINPKERTRRREQLQVLQQLGDEERRVMARRFRDEEIRYHRSCQSAVKKRVLPFQVGQTFYEYHADRGLIFRSDSDLQVGQRRSSRNVLLQGQPAARIIYALIHGPLPEDVEVYHVNNDPSDLTPSNLRMRRLKHYKIGDA